MKKFYISSNFVVSHLFSTVFLLAFLIITTFLSFSLLNIQSVLAIDENNNDIFITLKTSNFAPLTTVNGNQVFVSIIYDVNDDSLKGEKINGIMEIYASNGSLIKSSSYPDGFKAKKKGGVKDFKTTIKDPMIKNVVANITFTNLKKTKTLSNTITIKFELNSSVADQLVNETTKLGVTNENNTLNNINTEKKPINDVTFIAAGDFGCSKIAQNSINTINSSQPNLIFALGDLSYNKLPDCWLNMINPINKDKKVKFVLGEHDIDDNYLKYNAYMKYFNLTKPFYSFDYGNIHFLVMATAKNSVIPYTAESEQYAFVKNDLNKTSHNKDIDWIIVLGSRAFYSSPTTHKGTPELRNIYHPLFDKYDVDLVLYAHNHNYQRTFPIGDNAVKGSQPLIKDNETEMYNKDGKQGPIFVTVGTAGETLYPLTGQADFVIKQFLQHGFLKISFQDNGSTMEGTFYSIDTSSIEDKFTIKKNIN